MLPGKKYQLEDFVRVAWARKWFILVPAVLVSAATFVWAYSLPNRYRASATVLVVPQQVPEAYVRDPVTASVAERLATIQQQIFTRTRLERIIEEFNLYEVERKTMIMEDVVALMRTRDIKVNVARPGRRQDTSHFTVGFESSQPRVAMQVAERLASMFVQENLEERAGLAESTNQFLQSQLADAGRRLSEQEATLEAFRRRNSGKLPTQVQSNMHMLQITQTQIQSNVDAMNRERDRVEALEAEIRGSIAALEAADNTGSDGKGVPQTIKQQLATARANLKSLEGRFTENHPDVKSAKRVIADLEAKLVETSSDPNAAPTVAIGVSASSVATRLNQMRLEAAQLRKSLETRKAEDARLRSNLVGYSARLEATPKLESELSVLMRDYETLKLQYEGLLKKSEDSNIAVNLERRQIGEQFKVIDGARLPERPVSPDRLRYNLLGLLAGLAFGVALAGLLEYRDTTLKTDDDIVTSLALPVIAIIPAMLNAADRRRITRTRVALAVAVSVATIVIAVAVAVWRPELLPMWVR